MIRFFAFFRKNASIAEFLMRASLRLFLFRDHRRAVGYAEHTDVGLSSVDGKRITACVEKCDLTARIRAPFYTDDASARIAKAVAARGRVQGKAGAVRAVIVVYVMKEKDHVLKG